MLPLFLSFSSSNFTSRPNCYRCMLSTWISWFFPYNHSRSCLTSPDSFSALSSAFSLPALTSAAIRSLISPSNCPLRAVRSTSDRSHLPRHSPTSKVKRDMATSDRSRCSLATFNSLSNPSYFACNASRVIDCALVFCASYNYCV